ncbi:MAG: sulfotransferase family protein [Gemmatimonadales bacterium]
MSAVKRLFIVGCPRSGTTWTALLLAQHPEVRVCQQVGVVSAMATFWRWWAKGEQQTNNRYISSVVRFGLGYDAPRFEQLLTRDDVVRICRSIADQTYAKATTGAEGCRVVVDKTPENVRHPDLLAEVLPDAYYLHMIRDPRDLFVSQRHGAKEFGATFPTKPDESALLWVNDVRRGRRLGELVPNYRELLYRSLHWDGPATLTGLLEWLGLTGDPAWVEQVLAKTSAENLKQSEGTPTNFFRVGKVGRWRKELTAGELHALEFYARDLMGEVGFEPAHPTSTRKPTGLVVRDLARRVASFAKAVIG